MNFNIDYPPPNQEFLEKESSKIRLKLKQLTFRDTLITFILILICSFLLGIIMYWYTDSYQYAGLSVSIFPALGVILSITGITKNSGFRSAANKIDELNNELIGFATISEDNLKDIETLRKRHKRVNNYQNLLEEQNRTPVNSELAMYWEFDTSTMAKTAKGRDFLNKAKDSVNT